MVEQTKAYRYFIISLKIKIFFYYFGISTSSSVDCQVKKNILKFNFGIILRSTDVSNKYCFWSEGSSEPEQRIKSTQELPYVKM